MVALLGLSVVSVATVSEAAAQEEVKKYTIEQFLKTVSYSRASFSPDNSKILYTSDESGVFNAYSIELDGMKVTPLTSSDKDSIFTIGYFPDDERFLYTADQGGNELNHVYVRMLDGTSKDLTPGDKLKAQFLGWSQDDKSFYIGTNERDQRYFDVYEYDADSFEREMIFKNEEGHNFADITPDGQTIALSKTNTRDDSNVFLYDRDTQELKNITPHEGDINHNPATFSPDGKRLLFTTDADSEFTYLVSQDLETGERKTVKKADWDVVFASYSKHGKYFALGLNEDAKTKLEVYDAATMQPVELPDIEGASINSINISRDESCVSMYVSSDKAPSDLYFYDLKSGDPVKLTSSLTTEINPDHLVSGEVVRFKSFDGVEIPGILYKPHQASANHKVPALVWVHGGPGGQSRTGYRGLIQYLVNNGYVIYAINNRGSSGYGKSFQQLDDHNHGKGDLDDCVSSKKMLNDTGYVDSERIGIIGGSYGGYMTLAALTFRPQEFECGVDLFGISNWHRTVQSIPPWWESQRKSLEKELGDFDDEEYFRSISPLFHSQYIVKPLMVLQGANDPRVIKPESDEIVAAVKKNGVPCEYVLFDDEGHGFRKKANQLRGYKAILDFVDTHLKQ